VDSVFHALFILATQTQDSICHSPPGILLDFTCGFFLVSQKKRAIWCWLSTGLGYTGILKQIFTSVAVKSVRYLFNFHHDSPPLWWIIVNHLLLFNSSQWKLFWIIRIFHCQRQTFLGKNPPFIWVKFMYRYEKNPPFIWQWVISVYYSVLQHVLCITWQLSSTKPSEYIHVCPRYPKAVYIRNWW